MMMVVDIIFLLGILAGAVVPGNSFSTEGYVDDGYYDHIIDLSIEHLNVIKHGFSVDVKEPEYGVGTVIFSGLRSLSRNTGDRLWKQYETKSKRLHNGDLDLLSTFQFGNISGVFYVDNAKQTDKQFSFEFRGGSPKVEVLFMLTKDHFLKRVAFQFVEPPVYNHSPSPTVNATRLLVEKGPTAFNRLFKDLYNIIYGRLILTADRHDAYLDKVIDNVCMRSSPGSLSIVQQNARSNPRESIKAEADITIHGLKNVTRMKNAYIMDEINGDIDVRTTIQIGNVSGVVRVTGIASDDVFEDGFTFTSPPVVVEALFYLPRNRSLKRVSFHFERKPNFTIHPEKEHFRSSIEKILHFKEPEIYGEALKVLLNATHNEVFPKTEVTGLRV